jgi:hypothetical protein
MELVGDVGHVESHFVLFGDNVSFGARYPQFAPNVPLAQKSFWTHPLVLLGDKGQVVAQFRLFGVVLILTQDMSMLCAECTTGTKIILDAPDVNPT